MRSGQLRTPISIVERTFIDDGSGSGERLDAIVAQCGADIEQYSESEQYHAGQLEGRAWFRVRIRYQPGIRTANQDVLWGERRLRIRGIQNVRERNRELILKCEELQAGAA